MLSPDLTNYHIFFIAVNCWPNESGNGCDVNIEYELEREELELSIITIINDHIFLITVNCWPNESGSGCDVNIEYELEREELELSDVTISIPVP